MCGRVHKCLGSRRHGFSALVMVIALSTLFAGDLRAQSPSTGALTGKTLDPSGAVIPSVKIQIMRRDTAVTLSATSDEQGRFGFQLLAPGNYELQAIKASFDPLQLDDINIAVTEILKVILIGEYAHLGKKHEAKPLLLAAIHKAFLFTLLVFAFQVVEEVTRLLIHRENMATALHEIRIDDLLGRSLVVFCTFIPLFAFRELQRVLGEESFRALFFRTGTPSKSDPAIRI